jgi:hypothetical protein
LNTKPNKTGGNIKTLSVKLALALLVVVAALAISASSIAQNSNSKAVQGRTLIGFISDNHCGLKHMAGMGDDKFCTLTCVKNGKFVLADRRSQTSLPTRQNRPGEGTRVCGAESESDRAVKRENN